MSPSPIYDVLHHLWRVLEERQRTCGQSPLPFVTVCLGPDSVDMTPVDLTPTRTRTYTRTCGHVCTLIFVGTEGSRTHDLARLTRVSRRTQAPSLPVVVVWIRESKYVTFRPPPLFPLPNPYRPTHGHIHTRVE